MFESKGVKRTLASVFAVLAVVADFIPPLAPFKEFLVLAAGSLGASGILHAGVARLR